MRALVISLLFVSALLADNRSYVIERLAETAWLPAQVHAEWQSAGTVSSALEQHDDWKIAEPCPAHLAGSMILGLARTAATGEVERTAVSGTLHIFGPSLTVKRTMNAGTAITPSDIATMQADWTYLPDDALRETDLQTGSVAAHGLVPGRVLTKRDLKPTPLIHRGQAVELVYEEGAVRVRLTGRALQDGAVGERVQVAVNLKTSRKFEGCVAADGTVQLVR